MPREFGLAEAIAAALSGLTGGNFTNLLAAQTEEEKERAERAAYRAEETRRYEAEQKHRSEREALEDMITTSELTKGMFAELPQERIPSEAIPLAPGPGGTLTSAPDTDTRVFTGDPGIDAIIHRLNPGREADAALFSKSAGDAMRRERERERTEAREDLIYEVETENMLANGFQISEKDEYQVWVRNQRAMGDKEQQLRLRGMEIDIANGLRTLRGETPEDQAKIAGEARQALVTRYNALRSMQGDERLTDEQVMNLWHQAREQTLSEFSSPGARTAIYMQAEIITNRMKNQAAERGGEVAPTAGESRQSRPSTAPSPLRGTGGAGRRLLEEAGGLFFGN